MSTVLYRLGRFAARRPWLVIGSWFLLAAAVVVANSTIGRDFEDTFTVPGQDSDDALVLLEAAQLDAAGVSAQLVIASVVPGEPITDDLAQIDQIRAEFAELDDVVAVADPQISADGTVALVRVQYPPSDEMTAVALKDLKERRAELDEANGLRVEADGELFFVFEEAQTGTGEMIGIVAAIVILLIAFGSVIAMGLPIGTALFGLALGTSALGLVNYLIDIPSWAPQMVAMVGIGVGIDYALFLVTRHREYLAQGMTVQESVGRATATAGQAVIFAGGTVVIAILGLAVAGVPFLTAAGVATSLVVLVIAVTAAITLLPPSWPRASVLVNGIRSKAVAGDRSDHSPRWRPGAGTYRYAWGYTRRCHCAAHRPHCRVLALELGFRSTANSVRTHRNVRRSTPTTEKIGAWFPPAR